MTTLRWRISADPGDIRAAIRHVRLRRHIRRTQQPTCPSYHNTSPIAAGQACDTCGAQR